MPTALPATSDFTGSTVTEGQFKTSISAQRDYLSGLLGTDGAAATALSSLGVPFNGVSNKTAAYTVVEADRGKLINCSNGSWTLSLTAATTLAAGFEIAVKNSGTGVITIDPSTTEQIDSATTTTLAANESCVVICDGTGFVTVARSSSGVPSGTLIDYAGTTAPTGWLLCYGQTISRTTYASLFAAIGTTFGVGDGSTTFALPDMRGRVAAGIDDMGGSAASRITSAGSGITGTTLGAAGGSQTHTLTTTQMPSHSHSVAIIGSGSLFKGALQDVFADGAPGATLGTSAAGSGGAHPITQPTIMLNKLIKT